MLVVKRWPGDIWTSGARGELIKRDYGQKCACPERQLTLTETIDDIDIPNYISVEVEASFARRPLTPEGPWQLRNKCRSRI